MLALPRSTGCRLVVSFWGDPQDCDDENAHPRAELQAVYLLVHFAQKEKGVEM